MIDKSLGKQPLIDDSGTPRPNIDGTFYHNTMHPESSAIPAPQYCMPMNFYDGQKPPEQYNVNGTVRPVSVDRFQPVRLVSRPVRPVLVLWWRISRLLNLLLVCLLFRLILAEQMVLLVMVFLHTPLWFIIRILCLPKVRAIHMVQCQTMVIRSKHHIHIRIMHRKCRIVLAPMFRGQMILILIKYLRNIRKIWLLCLKSLSA